MIIDLADEPLEREEMQRLASNEPFRVFGQYGIEFLRSTGLPHSAIYSFPSFFTVTQLVSLVQK